MPAQKDFFKEETFKRFAENPCGKTAFDLVMASKSELSKLAFAWNAQGLNGTEKIRELICEFFLILLEDFKANTSLGYGSVVSFIRKRLLRVTCQRARSFVDIDDETVEEPADTGRMNFDAEKMQQADIVFSSLRKAMLTLTGIEAGILYFLFIHVYPEIRWASSFLTEKFGGEKELRFASDRKRIFRLNSKLRDCLKENKNFDLNFVMSWNRGERNYLAWRLISIAPSELLGKGEIDQLETVNEWRDSFDRLLPYDASKFNAAKSVYVSMQNKWNKLNPEKFFSEDAAEYGRGNFPDLLGTFVGSISENKCFFNEPSKTSCSGFTVSDKAFSNIAEELSEWFEAMFKARYNA